MKRLRSIISGIGSLMNIYPTFNKRDDYYHYGEGDRYCPYDKEYYRCDQIPTAPNSSGHVKWHNALHAIAFVDWLTLNRLPLTSTDEATAIKFREEAVRPMFMHLRDKLLKEGHYICFELDGLHGHYSIRFLKVLFREFAESLSDTNLILFRYKLLIVTQDEPMLEYEILDHIEQVINQRGLGKKEFVQVIMGYEL